MALDAVFGLKEFLAAAGIAHDFDRRPGAHRSQAGHNCKVEESAYALSSGQSQSGHEDVGPEPFVEIKLLAETVVSPLPIPG